MAKPAVPKGLRPGGKSLWDGLVTDPMPESLVALLTEACRARDRLDQLDQLLVGDVDIWSRLTHNVRTQDYELHIDDALGKANATAALLKGLLDKIPVPTTKAAPVAGGGTGLDQLAQRRAEAGDGKSTRARAASRRRTKQ